jgi:hypothetical protein
MHSSRKTAILRRNTLPCDINQKEKQAKEVGMSLKNYGMLSVLCLLIPAFLFGQSAQSFLVTLVRPPKCG